MVFRKYLVKYQYLLRFIASLCLILYVPWLIFSFAIVKSSYEKLLAQNEAYYRETAASFHTYFLDELELLRNHAVSFAYDNSSRNSKIIKEIIESHPYYFSTASLQVKNITTLPARNLF